jgi:hypothetical protein
VAVSRSTSGVTVAVWWREAMMRVIIKRCCGLDVHKERVVSSDRRVRGSTDEGGASIPDGDVRPRSLARVARGGGVTHRRLLAAGLCRAGRTLLT